MQQIIEKYANNPLTALDGAITNSDTVITVDSVDTFPSTGNFRLLIHSEILKVTKVDATNKQFTVERGVENSVAVSHVDNSVIHGILTKIAIDNIISGPIGNQDNRGSDLFLMCCHQSIDELIYLMVSVDGKDFSLIDLDPILIPGSGNQRDPSILKYNDIYWLVHTNSTNSYFTLLSSTNLKDWTAVTNVSLSAISGLNLVWAPNWFVDKETDGSIHVFVSCSTGGLTTNFQLYELHPTDLVGLSTWSSPMIISGTSLRANMIDPYCVKKGDYYNIFYKDDDSDYVEYMRSTSLTSGYVKIGVTNWAGWSSPREAPCLIKIDSSTWRMYLNEHSGLNSVAIYWSESVDDWATWSTPIPIESPWVAAHPDIVRVTDFPTARNILGSIITNSKTKGSLIRRTATQSISNTTTTAIIFDTEDRDDLNGWLSGTNPTRFTINTTGWYDLAAHIKWADFTGGKRVFDLRINGSNFPMSNSAEASSNHQGPDTPVAMTYYFTKGDYIELTVWQNSGSSVNVTAVQLYISRKS